MASDKIQHLLKNSGLPGPRGNLELLYSFSKEASEDDVRECLSFCTDSLTNSPEEFVVMCGITGYCLLKSNNLKKTLEFIRPYASHSSWRVREAVAIGIQEIAGGRTGEIIRGLEEWARGNDYEKRAVAAALCEPRLLKRKGDVAEILAILERITLELEKKAGPKLTDSQNTLRKTLGYAWSVAVAANPDEGKVFFGRIAGRDNKHTRWIIRENLKKKRLSKMDGVWVDRMLAMLE